MRIRNIKFIADYKMFSRGTEYSVGEKLNVIKGKGGTGKTIMSSILFKLAAGIKLPYIEVKYYYYYHHRTKELITVEEDDNVPIFIDDFGVIDQFEAEYILKLIRKRYTCILDKQVFISLRTPCYYEDLVAEDARCITLPVMT